MMDPEYTTVSVPPVDGHLGIFVGQDLWYPLFDSSNIENTVREICDIVGSDARSSSVSKWKLEERNIAIPPTFLTATGCRLVLLITSI